MSDAMQSWLRLWAWGVVLFGAVLAGAGFAATGAPALFLIGEFGAGTFAPDHIHRFAIGLMSAVSLGWGLTLLVTLRALFALDAATAAPLWRALTGAVLVWYVVDGAISFGTGFALNAVSNTALLALYLFPVLRSGVMRS